MELEYFRVSFVLCVRDFRNDVLCAFRHKGDRVDDSSAGSVLCHFANVELSSRECLLAVLSDLRSGLDWSVHRAQDRR